MLSQVEILLALQTEQITVEEAKELLDALNPAPKQRAFSIKETEKGAIHVGGGPLRMFGVGLYPNEWDFLFDHMEQIKEFKKQVALKKAA